MTIELKAGLVGNHEYHRRSRDADKRREQTEERGRQRRHPKGREHQPQQEQEDELA